MHEPASCVRARVPRRLALGFVQRNRIPETIAFGQGHAKAPARIDVMKLQVLRLEPRMGPIKSLAGAEFSEQMFLSYPIDDADERVMVAGQGIERLAPEFQHRVGFSIASGEELLGPLMIKSI